MKTWMGWTLAMMVAVLSVTTAVAQEGDLKAAKAAKAAEISEKSFGATDQNADGTISLDEIRAVTKARDEAIKAAGDNAEAVEAARKKYDWALNLFNFLLADSDDNQSLTKDELKAYFEAYLNGEVPRYSDADLRLLVEEHAPFWEQWDAWDADKDGSISQEEAKSDETIKRWDSDGDGKLSKDEYRNALFAEYRAALGYATKKTQFDRSAFALYLKQGRSWTLRTKAKRGTREIVSFTRTEVLNVGDESAEVRVNLLDAERNELSKPSTMIIEFIKPMINEDVLETADETIKVEAGEFECTRRKVQIAETVITTWTSKKHPGLVVKSETVSGETTSTLELVEYKD